MRVLLVDIDSKIPNLALMKIARYHRMQGDEVGFNIPNPDKVYASVIFKRNRHKVDGLRLFYPDADINIGGSGYDLSLSLPPEMESMSPDYSIYPECDRYYGFTTRGCIRKCPFCIVPIKEGRFHRLYDSGFDAIMNIVGRDAPDFRRIEFLDNNILADKEWFFELTDNIPRGWKVDFNQGLDVRLLDDEIAERIAEMRPITCWKFAYDSMSYTKSVLDGIEILRNANIDLRNKVLFYVYCDSDNQYEDAVQRCRTLKEYGTTAYVMLNMDAPQTKRMKALKRWTRPMIFWTIDIEQYGVKA